MKARFDLGLVSGRKLEARRSGAWIEEPGAVGTGLTWCWPACLGFLLGLWASGFQQCEIHPPPPQLKTEVTHSNNSAEHPCWHVAAQQGWM